MRFPADCGIIEKIPRKCPGRGKDTVEKVEFRLWLLLSLLWLAVILFHSCMPAGTSNAESQGLLAVVQMLAPWMTHALLRSLAHFFSYLLLGIFVTGACLNTRGFSLLKPLALCDETVQLFVPGRAGELKDLWVDFAGALLGTLLLRLLSKLRKH